MDSTTCPRVNSKMGSKALFMVSSGEVRSA
jgi:hypothetical protein